jgi:tryptophan synthase beta chain
MKTKKIVLAESELPRQWYNIQADMPTPLEPVLHPGTGEPVGPADLEPLLPMALIEQEVSQERWIDIPEEVLEKYLIWRPSPLYRAYGLEEYLKTPAKIYFKNEGVSPAGSHKPNTAIAQVYYNKMAGTKRIFTETGAGQWGSALSFATALFGIPCKVYMVKISFTQKPYRRVMMETWGAECVASPSTETQVGRDILARDPDNMGSLGIAISEGVERVVNDPDAKYCLGSALNHVLLHQTVIGLECQKQMAIAGDYPDVVIGCSGGGSNFGGIMLPYARDKIHGKDVDIIGVEPTSCPTMTRGPFAYDFADTACTTPLFPMHTTGHDFMPPSIHAGGLRYHGNAPINSQLLLDGIIRAEAISQLETFEAGVAFARCEGFITAPETNHALAMAIREAKKAKEEGKEKVILFNWSGHGLIDLGAYEAYNSGKLQDYALAEEELQRALKGIENLPKPKQYKLGKS